MSAPTVLDMSPENSPFGPPTSVDVNEGAEVEGGAVVEHFLGAVFEHFLAAANK